MLIFRRRPLNGDVEFIGGIKIAIFDQYMKAPMEKWTKSTFYSATVNEVSNGKMD